MLKLVNRQNYLSSTYIPMHLVQDPISKIWLSETVLNAFSNLNTALIKDGMKPLVLVSGYRPYDYQKMLYDKKIDFFKQRGLCEDDAREQASKIIATPGCSEHQLGLAIDVTSYDMKDLEDPLTRDFEEKAEALWLSQNSSQYGFILRYPKNKTEITQIAYEPWHYRYVGRHDAIAMQELGMCLEEYSHYTY